MLVLIALIGIIGTIVGFILGVRFGGKEMTELISRYYPESADVILERQYDEIYTEEEATVRRMFLRAQDQEIKEEP